MDIWLIISLIYFGIKTKKWRRLQFGNPNSLSSGRIYLSVIICSVTTFLCHLFIAVYRNVEFYENEAQLCKVISDMVDITYSSCFLSVILFLWFRQRTLYTAFLPMARFTKPLKYFSFIIIFVSFFLVGAGVILSVSTSDSIPTSVGCVFKPNSSFQFVIFVVIAIIFSQVSLLVMSIYALFASHGLDIKKRWKSLFCCKCQPSIENTRDRPADQTRAITWKDMITSPCKSFKLQ